MIKRNSVWIIVALLAIWFGLAGLVVSADGDPPEPSETYALGFLSPEGASGYRLLAALPLASTCSDQPATTFADEVARLINLERQARGLAPLKVNATLSGTAVGHSAYMRDMDCFGHQCAGEPTSAQRACNAGYGPYGWGACYIGETIAAGFQDPASVVAAWLGSLPHRDVMLGDKFREIGVGYVDGGTYGHYWTADFGSQPDVLPVFIGDGGSQTDCQDITLVLTNELVSGWGGMDYASEIMISNDPTFAGAGWEPYNPRKSWTLPDGNGPKTVYVKYRDPSGYEVVSTVTVVLNEPPEYSLELSTDSLDFLYHIGSGFRGLASGRVDVSNGAGNSPMSWNAAGGAPWTGYEPATGTTPGALVVSVENYKTNTPGVSQAIITVSSLEAPDSPQQVSITVRAVDQIYQMVLPYVARSGH